MTPDWRAHPFQARRSREWLHFAVETVVYVALIATVIAVVVVLGWGAR